LLDQLYETMSAVIDGPPNLRDQNLPVINPAVARLHRLLLDRIFIAEKLKEGGVIDDFLAIKRSSTTIQGCKILSRENFSTAPTT
jgi:hypothetical protein